MSKNAPAVREASEDVRNWKNPMQVHEMYISKDEIKNYVSEVQRKVSAKIAKDFSTLYSELEKIYGNQRFTIMGNLKVWYDRDIAGLYPMQKRNYFPNMYHETAIGEYKHDRSYLKETALKFDIPTYEEVSKSFQYALSNPISNSNSSYVCYNDSSLFTDIMCTYAGNVYFWMERSTSRNLSNNSGRRNSVVIPVCRLKQKNASAQSFKQSLQLWLENGLIPQGISKNILKCYKLILALYDSLFDCIKWDTMEIDEGVLIEKFQSGKITSVGSTIVHCETLLDDLSKGNVSENQMALFRDLLLSCDKRRANLDVYEGKRLNDSGHWDLCEQSTGNDAYVKINIPVTEVMFARPPKMDMRDDLTCGIDFGTKSTVVAVLGNTARMLRIGGEGVLSAPTSKDYENPTVVEIRNYQRFYHDYQQKEGRPNTRWEDVTVSHTAAEVIFKDNTDDKIYDSVLNELKQWAHDGYSYKMRDQKGYYLEGGLSYKDCTGKKFDPIEVYAYYLGLYINNMMSEGICTHYVLSYPVNFDKMLRQKILYSFVRGIRKSIPAILQNDDDFKERFDVYLGTSEPAAYAITALEQYSLQSKGMDDAVYYGVFDFGGGTTDFDFGYEVKCVAKNGKRPKYQYELHRFGNGGDVHLGGENILALLGYEVYKANIDKMREQFDDSHHVSRPVIPIVKPALGELFDGSEGLVHESRAARLNGKILAKMLRPIWEENEVSKKFGDKISAQLYSDSLLNDTDRFTIELVVDEEKLQQIIKSVIERGIVNFFSALKQAYTGQKVWKNSKEKIHIFLAGNSSKSKYVKELFEKYMSNQKIDDANIELELHPPLGVIWKSDAPSKDKNEISVKDRVEESKTIVVEKTNVNSYSEQRTGKTGVVFGLLRSRKGGRDVKIYNEDDVNEEARFPYYLGLKDVNNTKNFAVIVDLSVPYGKWVPFEYPLEERFELLYTGQSIAKEGILPVSDSNVMHLALKISENEVTDDDDVMIYVRKISPTKIEYAVAKESDFTKGNLKSGAKIYEINIR